VERPGLYLAIAVVALIVALWLVFQIIGFLFQVIFFALIVLVGVAAYRAWRSASPRSRSR
jgi:membrane protein implicated in regulation of membrane protease activity